MKEKVSLASLFLTFAKIGAVTFGGGMAILPMLLREICDVKGWATEKEISDYYAIGRCTPGIIAVNTATFIGTKTRGVVGGIVATFGIVFPSLIIIMTLAGVILQFSDNIYVQRAFAGIRVAVCVLIFNATIILAKSAFKGAPSVITFLVVTVASVFFNVSPGYIIPATIVVGIISAIIRKPKEALDD